jgi:hypothetical protein
MNGHTEGLLSPRRSDQEIEVPRVQKGDNSPAAAGRLSLLAASGWAPLLAALAGAAVTLLALRVGSAHTQASRRFAALPQFDVWSWLYATEVGAAAALGIASLPAFRQLARTTGLRASARAVVAWPVLGALLLLFGPHAVGNVPLWQGSIRFAAVNVIAGAFITPAFAGLLMAQARLATLAGETQPAADQGKAGTIVVELAWLRTVMLRFLITFAAVITAGLLALGALRTAVIAFGIPAEQVPPLRLLIFGGVLTAVTALIFVPAYVSWQERVSELRDALHPVPEDGRPTHDWLQARDDLDTLLVARPSASSVLAGAFGVLAPLAASLVSALLSASQ